MPFQILRTLNDIRLRHRTSGHQSTLLARHLDVLLRTWDLGFTAFGGPAVHFQILHERFVSGNRGKEVWVDEQTVCMPSLNEIERPSSFRT